MSTASISNRQAAAGIIALSAAIVAFLFWLIYWAPKGTAPAEGSFTKLLPTINAILNATSATFVGTGILMIKTRRVKAHVACMIVATVASALFLGGYLWYHAVEGDTKFLTPGILRAIYLPLLASHIILSMAVVPLILLTLFFAITKRFEPHKKIAAWTFPIWMYVSVTGVIVYFFLRMFNTPVAG
jgi:putative membrane protein